MSVERRLRALEELIGPEPLDLTDTIPLRDDDGRVAAALRGWSDAQLEGALEVLFGAYGEGDPHLSELLVDGWSRARDDKQFRLTMAWLREQSRMSLEEILEEGMAEGAFQAGLDTGAVAATILGAAEGCLLQAPSSGGPVAPSRLVRTLLALVRG